MRKINLTKFLSVGISIGAILVPIFSLSTQTVYSINATQQNDYVDIEGSNYRTFYLDSHGNVFVSGIIEFIDESLDENNKFVPISIKEKVILDGIEYMYISTPILMENMSVDTFATNNVLEKNDKVIDISVPGETGFGSGPLTFLEMYGNILSSSTTSTEITAIEQKSFRNSLNYSMITEQGDVYFWGSDSIGQMCGGHQITDESGYPIRVENTVNAPIKIDALSTSTKENPNNILDGTNEVIVDISWLSLDTWMPSDASTVTSQYYGTIPFILTSDGDVYTCIDSEILDENISGSLAQFMTDLIAPNISGNIIAGEWVSVDPNDVVVFDNAPTKIDALSSGNSLVYENDKIVDIITIAPSGDMYYENNGNIVFNQNKIVPINGGTTIFFLTENWDLIYYENANSGFQYVSEDMTQVVDGWFTASDGGYGKINDPEFTNEVVWYDPGGVCTGVPPNRVCSDPSFIEPLTGNNVGNLKTRTNLHQYNASTPTYIEVIDLLKRLGLEDLIPINLSFLDKQVKGSNYIDINRANYITINRTITKFHSLDDFSIFVEKIEKSSEFTIESILENSTPYNNEYSLSINLGGSISIALSIKISIVPSPSVEIKGAGLLIDTSSTPSTYTVPISVFGTPSIHNYGYGSLNYMTSSSSVNRTNFTTTNNVVYEVNPRYEYGYVWEDFAALVLDSTVDIFNKAKYMTFPWPNGERLIYANGLSLNTIASSGFNHVNYNENINDLSYAISDYNEIIIWGYDELGNVIEPFSLNKYVNLTTDFFKVNELSSGSQIYELLLYSSQTINTINVILDDGVITFDLIGDLNEPSQLTIDYEVASWNDYIYNPNATNELKGWEIGLMIAGLVSLVFLITAIFVNKNKLVLITYFKSIFNNFKVSKEQKKETKK